MPPTRVCPEETDLLAFAAGEDLSARLAAHVASCPRCRSAVRRLRAEIGRLRSTQPPDLVAPTTPTA
jgi:anti-sigma factor ChrR (cupin superfamily)